MNKKMDTRLHAIRYNKRKWMQNQIIPVYQFIMER
jgi:hypothetical protein